MMYFVTIKFLSIYKYVTSDLQPQSIGLGPRDSEHLNIIIMRTVFLMNKAQIEMANYTVKVGVIASVAKQSFS